MTGSKKLWTLFNEGFTISPTGTALSLDIGEISYQALRSTVLSIADQIVRLAPEARAVAVCGDKSLMVYASYLAATALALPVVPVDPKTPRARVANMLSAVGSGVVLASDQMAVPPIQGWDVLAWSDGTDCRLSQVRQSDGSEIRTDLTGCAYVMFTSGSTGTPKGVPINGDSVQAYVDAVRPFMGLKPGDRHTQNFALSFDLSVHDMFVTWASGATLAPPLTHRHSLVGTYVRERQITHWFSVPSAIDLAIRIRHRPTVDQHLRWIGFCGESLTYDQVGRVRDWYPDASIVNLYGPTELTIACAAFRLPRLPADDIPTSNGTVPIGQLFNSVEAMLMSTEAVSSEPDEGELLVRGRQRFGGYLDRSMNRPAFSPQVDDVPQLANWYRTGDVVRRLSDGVLVHLGRVDDQVKVAGFRVELSEVEMHLRSVHGIDNACVVALLRRDGLGNALRAFYTGAEMPETQLRKELAELVPNYMIPPRFYFLHHLPLSGNGKVDRGLLRRSAAAAEPGAMEDETRAGAHR